MKSLLLSHLYSFQCNKKHPFRPLGVHGAFLPSDLSLPFLGSVLSGGSSGLRSKAVITKGANGAMCFIIFPRLYLFILAKAFWTQQPRPHQRPQVKTDSYCEKPTFLVCPFAIFQSEYSVQYIVAQFSLCTFEKIILSVLYIFFPLFHLEKSFRILVSNSFF